jgi:hypothetical protein
VLEAAPFLLLGSLIGSLIEVYAPEDLFRRLLPRSRPLQVLYGMFAGLVLPTCECGVVPIARKLMLRGVPPQTAIPFMLAAPVVNPVVLASTWVAFQGEMFMLLGRVLLVLAPAAIMGWALYGADSAVALRGGTILHGRHGHAHGHDHGPHEHDHGPACACGCAHGHGRGGSRPVAALTHTAAEFMAMLKFLVLGALVAAAFKTFTPSGVLEAFSGNLFLSVPAMMLLAVLLSVCSEADAFVAASFVSFPAAAKLSFVALGPMLDLKLVPMFLAVFHRRLAFAIMLVPAMVILVLSLALGLFTGAGQ